MPYFTTSDGCEIWYEKHGDGHPILFLPGLGSTTWYWQRQFDLASDHTIVTIDPRGHGQSAKPDRGLTLQQAAIDVHELIEELQLSDVTLAGWSMGSFIVFEYIAKYQYERLKAVCSVDMTPRNTLDEAWTHAVFGDLDMRKVVDVGNDIIHRHAQWQKELSAASFANGSELDDDFLNYWTHQALQSSRASVLSYWLDLAKSDWRPLMPKLDIPTLLMHGSHSLACPTDVGEWMHNTIPNSRLVKYHKSGHVPFWEEPTKFNDELRNFVRAT